MTALTDLPRVAAYGDGLFETLPIRGGVLPLWRLHMARLRAGLVRLGLQLGAGDGFAATGPFPVPASPGWRALSPAVERRLHAEALEHAQGLDGGVLRLSVGRCGPARGYATEPASGLSASGWWWERRAPPVDPPTPVHLRLCRLRLAAQPALAGIKHFNRLEQVLARREWDDPAMFEGLLLDAAGQMVEATAMNLFWCEQGALLTPPLDRCGVAGTLRAALMEQAGRAGVRVQLVRAGWQRLLQADAVFLCGAVRGVVGVDGLVGPDGCLHPLRTHQGWRERLHTWTAGLYAGGV